MSGLICSGGCGCTTERTIEEDGLQKPMCVWCEDGLPCEMMADKAEEPMRKLPAETMQVKIRVPKSDASQYRELSTLKARRARPELNPRAEEDTQRIAELEEAGPEPPIARKEPKMKREIREKSECRHPTCKAMTGSKSGCCSEHFYWGTKHPVEVGTSSRGTSATAAVAFPSIDGTRVPVYLNAAALDRIWQASALEEKASMITDYMAKVHPA